MAKRIKEENILKEILQAGSSENEIYQSYFKKDFWTVNQFAALMAGITPEKYEHLSNPKNKKVSKQDFILYKRANKMLKEMLEELEKKIKSKKKKLRCPRQVYFDGNGIFLTKWKYIKWVAENQVTIIRKFFGNLPIDLMELYLEFQPINQTVRIARKWSREYHKAYYLQQAGILVEETGRHMTNEEIYQDSTMYLVRVGFTDLDGNPVSYKKRTIVELWLPRLFPKKRGRPSKKSSKKRL